MEKSKISDACHGGLAHPSLANHNGPGLQPAPNNTNSVESLTGLIERVTFFNELC